MFRLIWCILNVVCQDFLCINLNKALLNDNQPIHYLQTVFYRKQSHYQVQNTVLHFKIPRITCKYKSLSIFTTTATLAGSPGKHCSCHDGYQLIIIQNLCHKYYI